MTYIYVRSKKIKNLKEQRSNKISRPSCHVSRMRVEMPPRSTTDCRGRREDDANLYFLNGIFAILHTSVGVISIYCTHQFNTTYRDNRTSSMTVTSHCDSKYLSFTSIFLKYPAHRRTFNIKLVDHNKV